MKPHAIIDGLDALDAHPLIARAVAASLDVAAVGRAYDVEGCGPDQRITSCDAESAAHEIAQWQYGDDGAHTVTLEWIGTGSDGASVAEYRVTVDGIEMSRRIVVRTVSA